MDSTENREKVAFTHLHVHTQYSILDGAAEIGALIKKTKELGMNAIAITDHGNMFGVLEFYNMCMKNDVKPILGCEMYVSPTSRFIKDGVHFSGHHLILLAKNETGYKNLIKLDSLAFAKEAKYKTSRIDKDLLFEHHEGLICCSACLGGVLPKLIAAGDIEGAERTAAEYKKVFGDDYYIELQDHGQELQKKVMVELVKIAKKLDIKMVATNDVHFINADDYEAHKILICLNTGTKLSEKTKMTYTGQEYLKTPEEMAEIFKEYPDAISNSMEIAEKVEIYKMTRDPILPVFDIPESFGSMEKYLEEYPLEKVKENLYNEILSNPKTPEEDRKEERKAEVIDKLLKSKGGYKKIVRTKFDADYLRHLTFEGAKQKYGDPLPENVRERLESELKTIEWMGFPGYFLIVQDFINYSREHLGVIVGPGRGSAAGSVVAYCLGITAIEPLKYGLLFERFLNPDRISLPDIDVDFDDEGRAKTLAYVRQKYGADHVAQITTFGTMAVKSAIKDVARVKELSISESNRLANYVPSKPGITFEKAFKESPELKNELENGSPLVKDVLNLARKLEGSIKNTGIHACGVIIGPDDISNYVPLADSKESDMMATQFEGKLIESVGMIKMDFLGLRNLSIIKDACENIKKSHNIEINPSEINLDDRLTLELFQKGLTMGTFQFESDGMKQHLQNLKPDKFEDLIAMNALYRPGPMQYIPNFIARKHGKEEIVYEFPEMEKYLSETYGITVYQEQVMQLSQALAGFTPGQADKLRKAMGKKQIAVMEELREKFIKGCEKKGLDKQKVEKIWEDWKKFAEYAFNKSHSTCYAYVAFQTAYLKAHYPAEYMSSVLTHNLSDIKQITQYIEECKKLQIAVLGPNINESDLNFMVNKKGKILFGLAAIKGVGAAAAEEIIKERETNGAFASPFDFIKRVNLRTINKKCIEALIKAGAFDCFQNIHRAQYFHSPEGPDGSLFLDKLIKFGVQTKENQMTSQASLFDVNDEAAVEDPLVPDCEPWTKMESLGFEKEMLGFYISGHPLDMYRLAIKNFTNIEVQSLNDLSSLKCSEVCFAGLITSAAIKTTKTGKPYGEFVIEDESGSFRITLFGSKYVAFSNYCKHDLYVLIKANVQEKQWAKSEQDAKELEISIQKIELLEDVLKNYVSGLTISILDNSLSESFIHDLEKLCKTSKGKTPISMQIIDSDDHNIMLNMKCNKHKVDVSVFYNSLNSSSISQHITSCRLAKRAF